MKTWKQFFEDHEKDEEKTGMDTDHDNEIGESKEHKNKVKKAKNDSLDFFNKRKQGAAKIASEATAKGGPSKLTAMHFKAKATPYSEVLTAIKQNKDKQFFISKCKNLVNKLHFGNMDQKEFQEVMGILEVWGESLAQLFP